MFVTLFWNECRQMCKSITYYIFVACMVIFFIAQMGTFEAPANPQNADEYFGTKYSDDENLIMNATIINLLIEYHSNNYVTYPFGFFKEIILSESKQDRIAEHLVKSTGLPIDVLEQKLSDYDSKFTVKLDKSREYAINHYGDGLEISHLEDLKYEQFLLYMNEVDDIIGGGSKYSLNSVCKNALVPVTYEEAIEDYKNIIYNDHVTNAYARLFCDYMGIILSILPVFLAVSRGMKDKYSRAFEVIYSKKASSVKIILSRYFAMAFLIFIPLLLLSISTLIDSLNYADSIGVNADYFAFAKYSLCWLMPTILVVLSIGFFFTELTNGPIAILIQFIWCFFSLNETVQNQTGNIGWNLILRCNSLTSYSTFTSTYNQFLKNRIAYVIMSVVLILLTIIIYEFKRRGILNIYGKIFANRKSESKI